MQPQCTFTSLSQLSFFTDLKVLRARFTAKVAQGEPNDCWLWTAALDGRGYGKLFIAKVPIVADKAGIFITAPRLAYLFAHDSIEDGLLVLHHCDNKRCVNPRHLYAGTYSDNNSDTVRRKRNGHQQGTQRPNAILTDADIPIIRARYDAGESCYTICRSYGVSHQTIRNIGRRLKWKHVDERGVVRLRRPRQRTDE